MKLYILICICTTLFFAQDLTIKRMMSEPYLWGSRTSSHSFSPDGETVYFRHKKHKMAFNVSTLNTDTITYNFPRSWQSSNSFIYREKGKTLEYHIDTQNTDTLFSSDKQYQFFKKGQNTFLLKDSTLLVTTSNRVNQHTLKSGKKLSSYIINVSNSGRFAIIGSYKRTKERTLYFPNYLPRFTKPGKETRQISVPTLYLLDVEKNSITKIYSPNKRGYVSQIKFSDDESYVAYKFSLVSRKEVHFTKTNTSTKESNRFYTAKSDKWVVGRYDKIEFSPNSKKLLFVALEGSHERLFTHELATEDDIEQITEEEFDVNTAFWKNDDELIYISNQETPMERHIYSYSISNESFTKLSQFNGYIRSAVMSPKRTHLVYQFSQVATPDELYLFDINKSKQMRLSTTIPKEFDSFNFKKQELLKTKSEDGKFDIYANFYSSDQTKKPLVVFVHGAGILQNVLNGWTPAYHREFLFHQMLIKKGYHVLDVDYRGSIGYSHDFSTDVHSHLGKKELEDIVSFINLLDKKGLIDKDKVGIYGGSYGGFMASYAMAFQPDLFKAGAALRSVFTWENYYYTNEWYTRARLDKYETHKEWYERSSPLYHTDKIKNPLLILHGMLDNNVPFQDAVQMTQKMIDGHKKFDLMMYPKEKHSFRFPNSWIDEYKRIYDYFELYVK